MGKVLKSEYDNATATIHREKSSMSVEHAKPKKPWAHLENILTGEDAVSFGRAIEEAFPTEPVRK
jgi:hypothetical protein